VETTAAETRTTWIGSPAERLVHADYPALYRAADGESVRGQRRHRLFVAAELVLVIGGAMLAALGTLTDAVASVLPALGAVAIVAGMLVKVADRQSENPDRWFDGRAVAETVKTQTWRYMLRVPPFQDDRTADRQFVRDLVEVARARPIIHPAFAGTEPSAGLTTPGMRAIRALPSGERLARYLAERLDDQIGWYRGKALRNRTLQTRWFLISLAAQALAVAFAVTAALVNERSAEPFVALLAAIAASATAWTQLGRHEELSRSYALAYQELVAIRSLAPPPSEQVTEQEVTELVVEAELAISREHTMWMAKRGEPVEEPAR
jgi:hypothetical protein